jgi:hypothetical protein
MRIQSTTRGSRRCTAHIVPRRRPSAGMMLLLAICAWSIRSMLIPPVVDAVGDRMTEPFLAPLSFWSRYLTTIKFPIVPPPPPVIRRTAAVCRDVYRPIATIWGIPPGCSFERGSIVMMCFVLVDSSIDLRICRWVGLGALRRRAQQ